MAVKDRKKILLSIYKKATGGLPMFTPKIWKCAYHYFLLCRVNFRYFLHIKYLTRTLKNVKINYKLNLARGILKMKWFANCENLEQLKKTYKELIMKHHPDRGGDNATMAEINNEYEKVFKILQNKSTSTTEKAEKVNEYRDLIHELLNLAGIQIEICGAWLWISGETKPHKERLGELNCHYAGAKKMWYWRAEDMKGRSRKPQPMDHIRQKYGSTVIKAKEHEKLEQTA